MSEPVEKLLFRTLEPPPGGLAQLRARLDERHGWRARRWLPVAALGAAALAVTLLLLPSTPEPGLRVRLEQAQRSLVGAHGQHPPLSLRPESASSHAIERLSSDRDEVVIYLVGSLAMPEPGSQGLGAP